MKKLFLILSVITIGATAWADRPTTDELAVRLGVRAWFSAHSVNEGQFDFERLSPLYRPDFKFTESGKGKAVSITGLADYKALLRPMVGQFQDFTARPADDVSISVKGGIAISTFSFRPQGTDKDGRPITCGSRVSLMWQRHNGLWQIAREETTPLTPTIPAELATAK